VFQGLDQAAATAAWKPFMDFVQARSGDYTIVAPLQVMAIPPRAIWDPQVLRKIPGLVVADSRPGAPVDNIVWAGDAFQASQFIHGYGSAWLSQALLAPGRRGALANALFAASQAWGFALHFNKGLAGAIPARIEAARDTATNPQVLDAFALLITGSEGVPPMLARIKGHTPDLAPARQQAAANRQVMEAVYRLIPDAGSYVSESDYFLEDWQRRFWGPNHARLQQVKQRYDPDGLFTVHHGVGSEAWSADGFTRIA